MTGAHGALFLVGHSLCLLFTETSLSPGLSDGRAKPAVVKLPGRLARDAEGCRELSLRYPLLDAPFPDLILHNVKLP